MLLPLMTAVPVWRRVSLRLDKRGAAALSALVFVLGGLGLMCLPWWGVPGTVVSSVLIGVGLSRTMLLPGSMLADCMATGADDRRQGGVLSGLWTSGEAMAQSVGTGLPSLCLAVSGYVESGAGEAVQ